MRNFSLFPFVDLTRFRSRESLERGLERLLSEDGGSPPIHYALIRPGVKKYISRGFDQVVLDELHARVSAYEPYSSFTENEKTNSLLAIELMRSMEVPHVKGISFERGVTIVLPFGGIILRIALDAVLIWVDDNGIKHVGSIKAKIKKGTFLRESGEMAACLIAVALKFQYPDAVVDPHLCYCYDLFRQRLIPALNMRANLDLAMRVAEWIASIGDLAA